MRIKSYIVLLFFYTLAWSSPSDKDNCLKILEPTKQASVKVIAEDFPWWFNLGLAKTETNCKWKTSLDGHGSVGYFQLTPKFLDTLLRPIYPDYTKPYSTQHFYAFAYYLKTILMKPLWITYQRYNGGDWVLKECNRAGSFKWEDCKKECRRGMVCVWKVGAECKQYRSACDINYSYSLKIYKNGLKYKSGTDTSKFTFF